MTREDITRMAREAGINLKDAPEKASGVGNAVVSYYDLERFAALARADERETWQPLLKAAQGVIEWTEVAHRPPVRVDELEVGRMVRVRLHALTDLDAAIRARGNT